MIVSWAGIWGIILVWEFASANTSAGEHKARHVLHSPPLTHALDSFEIHFPFHILIGSVSQMIVSGKALKDGARYEFGGM